MKTKIEQTEHDPDLDCSVMDACAIILMVFALAAAVVVAITIAIVGCTAPTAEEIPATLITAALQLMEARQ